MKNELVVTNIENMIYEIRGKQVMLDSDLAKLYQIETKRINEAVKRNSEKFPDRFSWVLDDEQSKMFEVAICDLKPKIKGGRTYNIRVFTEQGVAMLATILKTPVATQVSIQIMDAFVAMRKYISSNLIEQKYINNQVMRNTEDIKLLKNVFDNFKPKNNHIFYKGEGYDAYSYMLDIFDKSKESIVIIDNYADKKLLDLLSKTKKKIKVYSKNMNKELIDKYQKQYSNVEIIENNEFHDRFIIVDNTHLYHCGASFKELGNNCFLISKIEDKCIVDNLISKLN